MRGRNELCESHRKLLILLAKNCRPGGLYQSSVAAILAVVPNHAGGFMDSSSQSAKWTPYEVKAASILYERRSEDVQLEQLLIRLQKKIREAEDRTSDTTAA